MSGGELLTSTVWYVTVEHQPVRKGFSYENKTTVSSIYSYLPHLQFSIKERSAVRQHYKAHTLSPNQVRLLCVKASCQVSSFLALTFITGHSPSVHPVSHLPNAVYYYLLTGDSGRWPVIVCGLYAMIKTRSLVNTWKYQASCISSATEIWCFDHTGESCCKFQSTSQLPLSFICFH